MSFLLQPHLFSIEISLQHCSLHLPPPLLTMYKKLQRLAMPSIACRKQRCSCFLRSNYARENFNRTPALHGQAAFKFVPKQSTVGFSLMKKRLAAPRPRACLPCVCLVSTFDVRLESALAVSPNLVRHVSLCPPLCFGFGRAFFSSVSGLWSLCSPCAGLCPGLYKELGRAVPLCSAGPPPKPAFSGPLVMHVACALIFSTTSILRASAKAIDCVLEDCLGSMRV